MYEEHLALRAELERRAVVVGADGTPRASARASERQLLTVLGRVPVPRLASPTLLVAFLGLSNMLGCHATPSANGPTTSHMCTEVEGLPGVMLSYDGGKTFVQSKTPQKPGTDVRSIVALHSPDTLLALTVAESLDRRADTRTELFASEDGGCHWTSRWRGQGRGVALEMVEGGKETAYGLTFGDLVSAFTVRGETPLNAAPDLVADIAEDPSNAQHLRLVGRSKGVFESHDGGMVWVPIGGTQDIFGAATDPYDWKHVIAAHVGFEPSVSHDGGRTWTPSVGFRMPYGGSGALPTVMNSGVVWAVNKSVYRSTDGGTSFVEQAMVPGDSISRIDIDPHPSVDVRRQSDPYTFLRAHNDKLFRYDARLNKWKTSAIPINPNSSYVSAATFVPGGATLCLGISNPAPRGWTIGDLEDTPATGRRADGSQMFVARVSSCATGASRCR